MKIFFLEKKWVIRIVLIVWVVLWLIFLIREDKDDQYKMLGYLYSHGYNEKVGYIVGDKVNDLILYTGRDMAGGFTYDIKGFDKFSIDEVRARYYLWPYIRVYEEPDFIIVYGPSDEIEGYENVKKYPGIGSLQKRRK